MELCCSDAKTCLLSFSKSDDEFVFQQAFGTYFLQRVVLHLRVSVGGVETLKY